MMKKLFIVLMAPVLALSLSGLVWAQEKAPKEEPAGLSKPAIEKSAEIAKLVSAKPHIWRMGGLVVALDLKSDIISIHQETVHHNRVMKLRVDEKVVKELSNIKPGDLVDVWVSGRVVRAMTKVS
jgi:hypothetical protein